MPHFSELPAFVGAARGEALRKFRAIRNFTQAQAAAWYGVSERTWRRWENTGIAPEPVIKRIVSYARRHPLGHHITDSL